MAKRVVAKSITGKGIDDKSIATRFAQATGDVPWELGTSDRGKDGELNMLGGNADRNVSNISRSPQNQEDAVKPVDAAVSTNGYGKNLEARRSGSSREQYNLVVDNNLRGSVNYIVESEPHLGWDKISSVKYATVPKDCVDLKSFPQSRRGDGVVIYHANTPGLKVQGLQNVDDRDFPNNAVMVFYKTASSPFHMRNVKFPLDILFISGDNKVLAVKRMEPGKELYYPPKGTEHAIEAKAGWVEKNGIKIGSHFSVNLEKRTAQQLDNPGIGEEDQATAFVSPNRLDRKNDAGEEVPMTLDEVYQELSSPYMQVFEEDINQVLDYYPEVEASNLSPILGVFGGKPENSFGFKLQGDQKDVTAAVSQMGDMWQQKEIVIFKDSPKPTENLYLKIDFLNSIDKVGVKSVLDSLNKNGLYGASFIFDPQQQTASGIETLVTLKDKPEAKAFLADLAVMGLVAPNSETARFVDAQFIGTKTREDSQKLYMDKYAPDPSEMRLAQFMRSSRDEEWEVRVGWRKPGG